MQVTGKMLLDLAEHAKRVGTIEDWVNVAVEWIKHADEYISTAFHPEFGWAVKPEDYNRLLETNANLEKKMRKMTEVYSVALNWDRDETLYSILKETIKKAKNVID